MIDFLSLPCRVHAHSVHAPPRLTGRSIIIARSGSTVRYADSRSKEWPFVQGAGQGTGQGACPTRLTVGRPAASRRHLTDPTRPRCTPYEYIIIVIVGRHPSHLLGHRLLGPPPFQPRICRVIVQEAACTRARQGGSKSTLQRRCFFLSLLSASMPYHYHFSQHVFLSSTCACEYVRSTLICRKPMQQWPPWADSAGTHKLHDDLQTP